MSKNLRQFLTATALMVVGLTALSFAPAAFGQAPITTEDCTGVLQSLTGCEGSIRTLALRIVNFFLLFLGLVAVIMIIYGGILYVTAAGQQDKVDTAKNVILYAIVGIVIIMLSFAIVNTILKAGSGETV